MRWPWARSSPRREAVAADAPRGTAVSATPVQPRRTDWATLAPSSLTVGDASVARPQEFARDLVVRQPPPVALQQLGHDVRMEAPRGTITAVARTTSDAIGHAPGPLPLPRRAVQRSARGLPNLALPELVTAADLGVNDVAAPMASGSSTSPTSPPALIPDSADTSDFTTDFPVEGVPAASTDSTSDPVQTGVGSETGLAATPLPQVRSVPTVATQRSALPVGRQPVLPIPRVLPASPPVIAAPAGPTAQLRGEARVAAQSSMSAAPASDARPLVAERAMVQRSPTTATTAAAPTETTAQPSAHRRGIGAPMTSLPARVQRSHIGAADDMTSTTGEPATFEVPAPESLDQPGPAVTSLLSPEPAPLQARTDPALPVLRQAIADASVSTPRVVAPASAALVAARKALVGAHATAVVQRSTELTTAFDVADGEALSAEPAPHDVHGAQTFMVGGDVLPPHLAALVGEPALSPNAGAIDPGRASAAVGQSSVLPSAPAALPVLREVIAPAPKPAMALPVSRQSAASSGVGVSMPRGPLPVGGPMAAPAAMAGPQTLQRAAAVGGGLSSPAAQAALATGLASPTGNGEIVFAAPGISPEMTDVATVQRSADPAAPAAVQREPAAVPSVAAAAPAGGGAGGDLDSLAEQLYDRFKPMLTRDLLQERERSSLLLDL
jgi:hypothetical protein